MENESAIRYKNKARCKLCGDVLESRFRHDFVTCECGSLSIDGGLAYTRVLWRGGDCDEVYEKIYEPITPRDVQITATISAKERDSEQEYYRALCLLIEKAGEVENGKNNGVGTQDDLYKWEVPIRAQNKHGKEAGTKAPSKRAGASSRRKSSKQQPSESTGSIEGSA